MLFALLNDKLQQLRSHSSPVKQLKGQIGFFGSPSPFCIQKLFNTYESIIVVIFYVQYFLELLFSDAEMIKIVNNLIREFSCSEPASFIT